MFRQKLSLIVGLAAMIAVGIIVGRAEPHSELSNTTLAYKKDPEFQSTERL